MIRTIPHLRAIVVANFSYAYTPLYVIHVLSLRLFLSYDTYLSFVMYMQRSFRRNTSLWSTGALHLPYPNSEQEQRQRQPQQQQLPVAPWRTAVRCHQLAPASPTVLVAVPEAVAVLALPGGRVRVGVPSPPSTNRVQQV